MSSGAGEYRVAALRTDDLWRVAEAPHAPADARAFAAAALRPTLDGDGKARLRVVASTTAAPKLRVALDAAADGSDAEVDAALTEMATDQSRDSESKRRVAS